MTNSNNNLPQLDYVNNQCGFYNEVERYLIVASFHPWSGKWIESSYDGAYLYAKTRYFDMLGLEEPEKEAVEIAMKTMFAEDRNSHTNFLACQGLENLVNGNEKDTTRLKYLANIRVYAFFRKNEPDIFESMDYCPFCGAKLPERLDEKLTEILQKEYDLESWKDYKKAPKEFETDEWWKKRGL